MSPSLKYLMVSSIAARNASSDPMSLTATLGVELACVLLVMCGLAPDADREVLDTPQTVHLTMTRRTYRNQHGPTTARPAAARMINDMESVTTTERTRTRRSVQHMRAGSKGQLSPATIRPRYSAVQGVEGAQGVWEGRGWEGQRFGQVGRVPGRYGESRAGTASPGQVRRVPGSTASQGWEARWLGGQGLGDQWASTARSGAQYGDRAAARSKVRDRAAREGPTAPPAAR